MPDAPSGTAAARIIRTTFTEGRCASVLCGKRERSVYLSFVGRIEVMLSSFVDNAIPALAVEAAAALVLRGTVFQGNVDPITSEAVALYNLKVAEMEGPGLFAFHVEAVSIKECSFIQNSAMLSGAVAVSLSSTVEIEACVFEGNHAANSCGALRVLGPKVNTKGGPGGTASGSTCLTMTSR